MSAIDEAQAWAGRPMPANDLLGSLKMIGFKKPHVQDNL